MNTQPQQRPQPGPDCANFASLVPLLHSPELGATEKQRVNEHVHTCGWCQQLLRTYDTVDDALHYHYGGPASPFLSLEDIVSNFDPADTTPSFIVEPLTAPRGVSDASVRYRRAPGRITGIAAIAAVLLLVIFAGTIFSQRAGLFGGGVGAKPTITTMPATQVATPTSIPAVRLNVYFGANGPGSWVYALHSSDGSLNWRAAFGNGFQAPPVLINGVVYAVSENNLVALRGPADILWHTTLNHTASWMMTDGQALYIGAAVPSTVSTDAHGFIDAYDLTGHHLWSYGYDAGDFSATCAMSTLAGTMAVANGILYASSNCPQSLIEAVNASNGKAIWSIKSPAKPLDAGVGLAAAGTTLYMNNFVNGAGQTCALAVSTGHQLWCHQLSGQDPMGTHGAPVVVNGTVVVSTDLDLYALNTSNGSQLWTTHVGSLLGQPVVAYGLVYVTDSVNLLHTFQLSNGQPVWHVQIWGNGPITPVVADGVVYLGGGDGTNYTFTALKAVNATVIWKKTIAISGASPVVVG